MPDLKRVIKGLECRLSNAGDENTTYCPDCPYYFTSNCEGALNRDALELLKAHEPRVLRLSEINKLYTVYYEIKKFRDIRPAIVLHTNAVNHHRFLTHNEFFDFGVYIPNDMKYEKTWRCWNVMPTTEQRMEAKWDEPQ